MSTPATPSKAAATSTVGSRSHREDVLQFLDNLDSIEAPTSAAASAAGQSGNANMSQKQPALQQGKTAASSSAVAPGGAEDAQSVLDFLDDIVASRDKRSITGPSARRANTPAGSSSSIAVGIPRSGSKTSLRDSTSSAAMTTTRNTASPAPGRGSYLQPGRSNVATPAAASATANSTAAQAARKLESTPDPAASAGGWGWGSVWGAASAIAQQARTVAEEQVSKNLPKNITTALPSPASAQEKGSAAVNAAADQASKWRSGVLNMIQSMPSAVVVDVEKLRRDIAETGMKAFRDVIDAVAPPISQHEVIQVNLSHDMKGYEGVETLVYRALAKIMEQVDGGELVVNKGQIEAAQPQEEQADDGEERNLNTIDGLNEGYEAAQAKLDALVQQHYKKPEAAPAPSEASTQPGHNRNRSQSQVTVPVTLCPVYMRIQPVLAPLPYLSPNLNEAEKAGENTKHLFFILLLRDPTNSLLHRTLTQSIPGPWLDIPFEDNEWVEDIMVDVIRRGVEIIGEEYVKGRMHGRLLKNVPASDATDSLVFDVEKVDLNKDDETAVEKVAEAMSGIST